MMSGSCHEFYLSVLGKLGKSKVFDDPLHTTAFGTDASLYRYLPRLVVKPEDEEQVSFILKAALKHNIPVTFRAAGTSLSGQAVTDSVLLIISGDSWENYEISDNGTKIIVQPGLTGGRINSLLAPYGRKIGPDPASIDAATIGGIVANNASGLRSRSAGTSYSTVRNMKIIFADGTKLDTGDENSKTDFLISHPEFFNDLLQLSEAVKKNSELYERIRFKYRLKNTMGYSLNALTDFSDPFDIIKHLMIGSEGTLGFISEITLDTVPEKPCRASSLMVFPGVNEACTAVLLLSEMPVEAVEFIDRNGLRSVEDEPGMPAFLKGLGSNASALLVETTARSEAELKEHIDKILRRIKHIPSELPLRFAYVQAEYEELWKIRKGLFPSAGAMRKRGTSAIIEDIAVPVNRLAEAVTDLHHILSKYGYESTVVYGHALEGNLHFVLSQNFADENETMRYRNLMEEVVHLIVEKYDGSLKAEHGTGRNMAPFVEMEWGREAYEVMKRIKKIFDPQNILNPGVILNDDPEIHLKNLKITPEVDEIIDKCIECGFCETSCVSAGLTLTARQRIAVFREMFQLYKTGHRPHILASLAKSFEYSGKTTCAADGLCSINCPVGIDTGKLVKTLRSRKTKLSKKTAVRIASNLGIVILFVRFFLTIACYKHKILGTRLMNFFATVLVKISGNRIPVWNPFFPRGSKKIKQIVFKGNDKKRKAVYFPSCINRTMGVSADYGNEKQLSETMISLMKKAGYEVIFPQNLDNLCCGMAFLSKGFTEAGIMKSNELEEALFKASHNGEYPVVCDMSPCLFTMRENSGDKIKLFEPVEFILQYLLPYLEITPLDETITVFPVCSMKKMGLETKLVELAKMCAREVIVPETNCCGFAGDKGFFNPELNRHGLRNLKKQIPGNVNKGYSTSRTCEIGLTLHSGISFKSVVYLVDMVTRPKGINSF
ncbi:MAG: FAD-binding and (Fe-S)-binding domain-containing protein [Bacteroidales bacterium]